MDIRRTIIIVEGIELNGMVLMGDEQIYLINQDIADPTPEDLDLLFERIINREKTEIDEIYLTWLPIWDN